MGIEQFIAAVRSKLGEAINNADLAAFCEQVYNARKRDCVFSDSWIRRVADNYEAHIRRGFAARRQGDTERSDRRRGKYHRSR